MRRCPDCGFRAKDTVCPLCGVKMKPLPAAAKELQTHAHKQTGETCTLPNRVPVKQPPTHQKAKPRKQISVSPKLVQIVLVLIVVILFRACGAF